MHTRLEMWYRFAQLSLIRAEGRDLAELNSKKVRMAMVATCLLNFITFFLLHTVVYHEESL